MQQQQERTNHPRPFSGESCEKCGHIRVCAVFQAIAPLIQKWKGKPPFNPEDLAKICSQYIPKTVLDNLGNHT